jgi:DNA-binding transcriptional MerR regulator
MPKRPIHDPAEWFTAARAARLSGLTQPMVNYLCREDLVTPSCNCPRGHGVPRHYAFGDVVALRLVARLSKAGVSPLRLKKGLQYLRKFQPEITLTSLPASHLVTDGQDIYLRAGSDALERATDGQFAFAFVIELDHVRSEVARKLTPSKRASVG